MSLTQKNYVTVHMWLDINVYTEGPNSNTISPGTADTPPKMILTYLPWLSQSMIKKIKSQAQTVCPR